MKITYDKIADAVYLTLKKGRVVRTKEIGPDFIVDQNKNGDILGLEILNASRHLSPKTRQLPLITIGKQTIPLPSLNS